MPSCSVSGCLKKSATSSLEKDNITFHLFPKDKIIRDAWIRACANYASWMPKRTSTICSKHFEPSCFILRARNKRRLKQEALPTLELKKSIDFEDSDSSNVVIKIEKHDEDPTTYIIQECKITEDQTCMSQSGNNISKSPTLTHNPQLQDTPKEKKLKQVLQMKCKQIKRLQTQIRYLKKKVVGLQELLNNQTEKSLIHKENWLLLDKIGRVKRTP